MAKEELVQDGNLRILWYLNPVPTTRSIGTHQQKAKKRFCIILYICIYVVSQPAELIERCVTYNVSIKNCVVDDTLSTKEGRCASQWKKKKKKKTNKQTNKQQYKMQQKFTRTMLSPGGERSKSDI